jgi:hypothetical protein
MSKPETLREVMAGLAFSEHLDEPIMYKIMTKYDVFIEFSEAHRASLETWQEFCDKNHEAFSERMKDICLDLWDEFIRTK